MLRHAYASAYAMMFDTLLMICQLLPPCFYAITFHALIERDALCCRHFATPLISAIYAMLRLLRID